MGTSVKIKKGTQCQTCLSGEAVILFLRDYLKRKADGRHINRKGELISYGELLDILRAKFNYTGTRKMMMRHLQNCEAELFQKASNDF